MSRVVVTQHELQPCTFTRERERKRERVQHACTRSFMMQNRCGKRIGMIDAFHACRRINVDTKRTGAY